MTIRGVLEQQAKVATEIAEAQARAQAKTIIEPHCEIVAYLPLVTTSWLFFKPLRMSSHLLGPVPTYE